MLLLFLFIALNSCIKFSFTDRCACSEYEETYCRYTIYCSWDGTSCIDMQCKYQSELLCEPYFTKYQCKWNDAAQTCEDHQYQCSDLTKDACFSFLYGMDCMWQDGQCKPQDCTELDYCNPLECSRTTEACGQQMDSLDCSSYSIEKCQVTDGKGNVCKVNDNQQCKEYPVFTSSCSAYEDNVVICNALCYYDIGSQSCISKECSQITEESLCQHFLVDIPSLQFIPCKWANGTCNELTEEDFKTVNVLDCIESGALHYIWQPSTSTCKQCTSLVDNPDYQFYKDLMNGIEILKWILVWLALYI